MKIAVIQFFLFVLIICSYANDVESQEVLDKKISISVYHREIKHILNEIEKQTGAKFIYSPTAIKSSWKISVHITDQKLGDFLTERFHPLYIFYKVMDNKILLYSKPEQDIPSITSTALTHFSIIQKDIKGRVTSLKGEPLSGVSVKLKGSTIGTSTESDGTYEIHVPDQGILVFTHIGYVTQEVPIDQPNVINVILLSDVKSLSEVVVTGYSSQAKRDITGAVSIVDVKDLTSVPNSNFAQQLQGRVAGVTVTTDGAPGGETLVRIRGIGSITGSSDPLYIIDGVPMEKGLRQLNPADIESMQILKDASSASIYGARASNGVVLITTKKGKSGNPQISFEAFTSTQRPQYDRFPTFMSPLEQAEYTRESNRNANGGVSTGYFGSRIFGLADQLEWLVDYAINPTGTINFVKEGDPLADPSHYSFDPSDPEWQNTKYIIVKLNKEGTNWFREVYKPAALQNYNLTVSGATDKSRYALSTGYFDQDGILLFTNFKRYSIRANSEFKIANIIRIGENLQFSYTKDNNPSRNSGIFSGVGSVFYNHPIAPVYDIGGNFTGTPVNYLWNGNPVARQTYAKDNINKEGRIFGNVYIEADILKGLTARSSIGLDHSTGNTSVFEPHVIQELGGNNRAFLTVTDNYATNWIWTNTLNYSTAFAEKHQVSAFAGTEAISNSFRDNGTSMAEFVSNDVNYRFLSAGEDLRSVYGVGNDSRLYSLFGKINYSFDDRYLFSATVRRDASSRFSEANRWGTFPAFSFGWRISSEDFMKNAQFISDLKLRASWGQAGNQNIGDYNQYSTYAGTLGTTGYDLRGTGNSVLSGYARRRVGNPIAKWEAQTMSNLGLDAMLFENKLAITLDVYDRKSKGLLMNVPHPAVDGQKIFPAENVGGVQNRGVDLLLSYNGHGLNKELNYNISVNWSTFKNKVTALYEGENAFIPGVPIDFQGTATRTVVGRPISSFFGMIVDGIFQTDEEASKYPAQFGNPDVFNKAGRWKYRDVDGDGTISSSKDLDFIGDPTPSFTYGLNLSASYKGFDATVFMQGVQGNDVYNSFIFFTDFPLNAYAISTRVRDSWTPSNVNAKLPQVNDNAVGTESLPSSHFVESGSYLRCKNAQLGYSLPKKILSRIYVSRLRVYLTGTNLFTFTKYTGIDPEVTVASGSLLTAGVDYGIYPFAKTYTIGVQLGL